MPEMTIAGTDLLSRPHHDGSALYVSNLRPRLGDTVSVRVRVPHEADVSAVHVRLTPDAEPIFVDALAETSTGTETWWRAEIICRNPVTSYRFILEGGPTTYQWLNGTGVHERDVPDAADFRLVTFDAPPAWDFTTNHTGDAHEWFQKAKADPVRRGSTGGGSTSPT
jgi:alpha-glucosidase